MKIKALVVEDQYDSIVGLITETKRFISFLEFLSAPALLAEADIKLCLIDMIASADEDFCSQYKSKNCKELKEHFFDDEENEDMLPAIAVEVDGNANVPVITYSPSNLGLFAKEGLSAEDISLLSKTVSNYNENIQEGNLFYILEEEVKYFSYVDPRIIYNEDAVIAQAWDLSLSRKASIFPDEQRISFMKKEIPDKIAFQATLNKGNAPIWYPLLPEEELGLTDPVSFDKKKPDKLKSLEIAGFDMETIRGSRTNNVDFLPQDLGSWFALKRLLFEVHNRVNKFTDIYMTLDFSLGGKQFTPIKEAIGIVPLNIVADFLETQACVTLAYQCFWNALIKGSGYVGRFISHYLGEKAIDLEKIMNESGENDTISSPYDDMLFLDKMEERAEKNKVKGLNNPLVNFIIEDIRSKTSPYEMMVFITHLMRVGNYKPTRYKAGDSWLDANYFIKGSSLSHIELGPYKLLRPVVFEGTPKKSSVLRARPSQLVGFLFKREELDENKNIISVSEYLADIFTLSALQDADLDLTEYKQKALNLATTLSSQIPIMENEGLKMSILSILDIEDLFRDSSIRFNCLTMSSVFGSLTPANTDDLGTMEMQDIVLEGGPRLQRLFAFLVDSPSEILQDLGISPSSPPIEILKSLRALKKDINYMDPSTAQEDEEDEDTSTSNFIKDANTERVVVKEAIRLTSQKTPNIFYVYKLSGKYVFASSSDVKVLEVVSSSDMESLLKQLKSMTHVIDHEKSKDTLNTICDILGIPNIFNHE